MTNLQAKNEILRISRLSVAKYKDIEIMFDIYKLMHGNVIGLCKTCPSSVRTLLTNLNNIIYQYNDSIDNNPNKNVSSILTK